MTLDRERLEDFARDYTQAWCSQDPAQVAAHYAPDGSLTINGGEPAVGREALTEVARSFMTDFPDMQVLFDDLVLGDKAVYHWTLVGTHAGSDNRVRISGYEEWTIGNDGLIAESQGHYDQAEYERQVRDGAD
jgi:uncharacterized protein (TIGR02246 family)